MQRHLQTFQDLGPLLVKLRPGAASVATGPEVRRESSGSSLTPEGTSGWSLSWSQIGVLRCKSHRVTGPEGSVPVHLHQHPGSGDRDRGVELKAGHEGGTRQVQQNQHPGLGIQEA